jgi:outer membrane protein assembly factor BamB
MGFLGVWMVTPTHGTRDLTRYAPMNDGDTQLIIRYDREGEVLAFRSQNVEQTYRDSVLISSTDSLYQSLQSYVLRPNEAALSTDEVRNRIAKIGLYEVRVSDLTFDGTLTRTSSLVLRSQRGDHLAATWLPGDDSLTVYNPPMMLHPGDISPGRTWETEGRVSTGQKYQLTGYIEEVEEYIDPKGRSFDGCMQIIQEITIQGDSGVSQKMTRNEWLCSGIGLVNAEELHSNGLELRMVVGRSTISMPEPEDLSEVLALMPPLPTLSDDTSPDFLETTPVTDWRLSLIGNANSDMTQDFFENTFSPTWLPTDPPILLTARSFNNVIARDPASPTGSIYWEYSTGSQVYKEPVFDAKRGQVYLGTADKRLIALDGRGLFLWVFHTNGNTASRPVIIDDLVIFGCEDHFLYAVKADTGQLIWKSATGGPIVSSPTLADDLVVIGSDDGLAYAFEIKTGILRWTFETDKAIEAPIVNVEGKLLIASRDGFLYAVDAGSGVSLWKADTGAPLRTIPLLLARGTVVVTSDGDLYSFETTTGKALWANADHYYNAPLLLAGETILAASDDGHIYFLSLQGKETAQALSVQPLVSDATNFNLGISQGGKDIWLGDNWGRIWVLSSPNNTE